MHCRWNTRHLGNITTSDSSAKAQWNDLELSEFNSNFIAAREVKIKLKQKMWSRVKKRPSSSIYSFDEKEKTLYEKEKMGTV